MLFISAGNDTNISLPYIYRLSTALTTHPSFDKNAGAFLSKSTFPHQGRLGRTCEPSPYTPIVRTLSISRITIPHCSQKRLEIFRNRAIINMLETEIPTNFQIKESHS